MWLETEIEKEGSNSLSKLKFLTDLQGGVDSITYWWLEGTVFGRSHPPPSTLEVLQKKKKHTKKVIKL